MQNRRDLPADLDGVLASRSPPSSAPSPRAIGFSVVGLVMLLQVGTQLLAGHDRARVLASLLFVTLQMPTVMVTLSLAYGWAMRRQIGFLRALAGGILVSGVIGAGAGALIYWFVQHSPWLQPHSGPPLRLLRAVLLGLTSSQLHFGLWSLAFVLPSAIEEARVRSLEADKLRLEAAQLRSAAEVARLRANLEPHFLLNTLNAIAGLVTEDPREARRLLVCLGDLLRDALRDADEMQPLDEHVTWLRRYAEILEARHAGQLAFRWEVDGRARNVVVPRLLLQPLVENAVQHGALRRSGGGEVVIRATIADDPDRRGERLVCVIEDNGPGLGAERTRSGAFGLHAVRRRLELRYAHRASLRLESSAEGTRSIVELPRGSEVAS